jgi:hypothetical protein
VLESGYRADSNSAVRKDMWVRIPPAAPESGPPLPIDCVAIPPDVTACPDSRHLGAAYAYLLGLYLGDGCLSLGHRGVWHLRIALDKKYPAILEGCEQAIAATIGRASGRVSAPGCFHIQGYSKHWACIFPQAGPGPKHRRRIELRDWQRWIVEQHPRPFLRGLIHSDGCRVMNRVQHRKYSYPRYMFSNESADIRDLFTWACGLIGVESRPANRRNISVARRRSVAILDEFIGPKS